MHSSQPNDPDQAVISGASEIAGRRLREVRRPRNTVVTLDPDASCETAVSILAASGHTRAPVAPRGDLDHVTGVVHLRDLISATGSVADHAQAVLSLPESMTVLHALRELQRAHQHLAVVSDDFGGVGGIITIHDLLEEIVAEIYDETDRDIQSVERLPDGALILPGSFPVHDLTDLDIDIGNLTASSVSVAGLLLERLGHIPTVGETADVAGRQVTVVEVEGRAITRVRVEADTRGGKHNTV